MTQHRYGNREVNDIDDVGSHRPTDETNHVHQNPGQGCEKRRLRKSQSDMWENRCIFSCFSGRLRNISTVMISKAPVA